MWRAPSVASRKMHMSPLQTTPLRTRRLVWSGPIRMPVGSLKAFLLASVAAVVLVLGVAAPASAGGTPCWRALINDWYDGRIDETYPTSCYTDAIQHLPTDVDAYSSARDDIQRALLARLHQDPNEPPTYKGDGGPASGSSSDGGGKSIITRAIEWLGPSNASAVPLPLLILAGVAFLLLAAAGGSFVSRRIQERRLPPPPQA